MKWITGISCIYKITNDINGRSYIGQTKSIDDRHKYPSNYKNCTKLYKDILEFGWENFSREIVEYVDLDELDKKEFEYIMETKPFYNERFGKTSVNELSEGMKRKISESKKKDETINRIKVKCVETGEIFNSITDAADKVGATKISISRAARKIYKKSKGFTWEFV